MLNQHKKKQKQQNNTKLLENKGLKMEFEDRERKAISELIKSNLPLHRKNKGK